MNPHGFSKKRYRELLEEVGRDYYDCGDLKTNSNPGFVRLEYYCRKARSILDFGCGDGSYLNYLLRSDCDFVGVDVSEFAIKKGLEKSRGKKNIKLITFDGENLPFGSESFDLIYCTYVLEHIFNPEKCLREMIRVLKKGGIFVSIAPNYGSPIEFSPGFRMRGPSPLFHSIKLFLLSHLWQIKHPRNLAWNKVTPSIIKSKKYFPDSDAVCEPYVQTLKFYLENLDVVTREISSGIEWTKIEGARERVSLPLQFKLSDFLKRKLLEVGRMGFAPYKYFGPTLFFVGVKK